MNQLASAHERGLIQAKSTAHLVVEHHKEQDNNEQVKSFIKMKVVDENSTDESREITVDDVIDDQRPIFF